MANTANIARALRFAGARLHVTAGAREIANASKLVLPGVGSFRAAMEWLRAHAIDDAIREAVAEGAFLLGICVGHQLLFEASHEHGTTRGLGVVRGEVVRLDGALPVPQIGWNRLRGAGFQPVVEQASSRQALAAICRLEACDTTGWKPAPRDSLLTGIPPTTSFYFVNSYAVRCADDEIASAEYNGRFTAAVQRERVCGVQFHPEKSSSAGLQVLRNFIAWT